MFTVLSVVERLSSSLWVGMESWVRKILFNLSSEFSRLDTQGPAYLFVFLVFLFLFFGGCVSCFWCMVSRGFVGGDIFVLLLFAQGRMPLI